MKIKKILGLIILGVYLASDILSHLGYVNWNIAEAATSGNTTTPLVAILIDNETYNAIGGNSNFKRYTDNYIPEKYPDSEAVIFNLDTKEYDAPEIVKLLENVYFDGIKDTASRLIGVIIMGKIPLPVVKYQNYYFPSVYPYTDFIEQKYIWDEAQGYFVLNKNSGQSELWHGLISLDDATKYDDFFKKLKKYQSSPEKFIEKKIWYDDFIALNKNFLSEIYQLYKNKIIFAEDLMYHRYTNFLVNILQNDQEGDNAELLGELQESMAAIGVNIPEVQTAKEQLLNNPKEITPTLLLQNKISSFIKDYHESISTTLLRTIDDNIKAGDRYKVNDSHYQKIHLKDEILLGSDEANGILKSINDKLEEYVDQKIAKEKYDMKTTIPIYFQRWKDKRKRFLFIKRYVPEYKDSFQFYYFGQNASTISNAEEFSIYRGTYRNLEDFVNYSTIINDSLNPAKSKYDNTNLKNKGIGASYDLFSTQVESNRGFNILNMETEYDTYNKEKRYYDLEDECKKYWFGIKLFGCRERERRNKTDRGPCVQGSEEQSQIGGCETFPDFGNRVRGGATPLNLNMTDSQNHNYHFDGEYHPENAVKPIFDIAGSVSTTKAYPKATSYEASLEYLSPIKMADKGGNLIKTDDHTTVNNPRYFKLPTELLTRENFKKNSNSQFTIKKEKKGKTDEELTFIYNIVPSLIKHDATREMQINGYSGYKYGTGTETYGYYYSIMKALDAAEDDGYSTSVNTSMHNVKTTITNYKTKVSSTPNYTEGADTGLILSGINALSPELLKTLSTIGQQTKGEIENWRKFNEIFGNNYGATVESYVEGYSQHQIQLGKKIDIWSKWYDEIISKISEVSNTLNSKRGTAKAIFSNYNNIFTVIDTILTTIDAKIKELEELIKAKEEENTQLENENIELEEKIEELENLGLDDEIQDDGSIEGNETLTNEINELVENNEGLQSEINNLNNANNTLNTEIQSLESQIESLNTDKTTYTNTLNQKIIELNGYKTELNRIKNESAGNSDDSTLTAEKTKLENENKDLEDENKTLGEKNKKLKKENEDLEKENKDLEKENKDLKELNDDLEDDNDDGQNDEEIKENNETIEKNKKQIEKNNKTIKDNKDEITKNSNTIETNRDTIETNKIRLQEIASELSTNANNASAIAELENKISTLETQIASINSTLSGINTRITNITTTINNNRNQIESNNNAINEKTTTINNNQNEITNKKNGIIGNYRAKIESNNTKIEKNKEIIEAAKTVKAAREKLKGDIPEINDKVESSLNIIDKCTANHSVLGNIINAADGEIHYGTEDSSCEETTASEEQNGNAQDVISVLVEELNAAKTIFKENFNSDPDNPKQKIPGMNLLTPDRPIDSPRYVSFQGIGEHVIKLIYPDIFKVEVYNSNGGKLSLKKTSPLNAKNEIYKSLQTYFKNKVREYNDILKAEYNSAKDPNNRYYSLIYEVDKLATPTKETRVRPYGEFTYDEMIKSIGGDEMLYSLAELLYYQSVSNNIREYLDNIGEDINETKQTFDINKKIAYVIQEYLKEDNDKIYRGEEIEGKDLVLERKSYAGLVIPSYSTGGYEVGYINSNGADNITPETDEIDITLKGGETATRSLTADSSGEKGYNDEPGDDEASQDVKKDCGYDPNETLSLYDGTWFKGLACWLKAVAKKPVTVKVYFQTSPTISSISEPIEESRDTFKESFKTTIEGYADTPKSSENLNQRTQRILSNTQVSWNDNKVSITGKTGSLNFLSFEDLGNIIVKIQSTGDNCLVINGANTCGGPVTVSKNPYKEGFKLNYTLGKNTIGNVMTNISLCSSADNCGVKNMSLAVVPGPVSTFKIETTSDNKVLAGAYTLLNIKALDSKGNEIGRTLEKYYVKVNKGSLFMNGGSNTIQEINDFDNSTMLYRAEKGTAGTVNITVEDEKGNIMGKNTINIFPGEIKINDKDNEEIEYTVTDEKYYNDNGSINTKKAIPLKISLKYGGQTVKITSNASFGAQKGLAKIMIAEETKDKQNNKKIKLRAANSIMIENGERTVYLVPGYKAGEEEISVTVPGLDTKKIKLKIKPGEMKNIGIDFENDTLYPEETLKGEVSLTDARGNKIEKSETIKVKSTTENKVSPTENPNITKGERKFSLNTTENDAGIQQIIAESSDGKIRMTRKFTVKNFFLKGAIESGLNIMYLNLFGNDWGNQRGYYSDNNKYSENIIQKSSKTLAVTTQLISPEKIRETNIVFGKKGNIQNNGGLPLKAKIQNNNLKLTIENIGEFTTKDNVERIIAIKNDPGYDWIENTLKNEKGKIVYLFDINENYSYEGGIFKTADGKVVANMKDDITFEWADHSIGTFPIWEATKNGETLGNAIITNLDYSTIEGEVENIKYEIGEIFDRGSTSGKIKALQSTVNTLKDEYQGYDSIENSDELEKYIGFRGEFKNITLFSEGESVGESTVPFGSEFLINIGDPLLKNRDEVASKRGLGQVKFSEPTNSIFKVTDIDYNADGLRDLIVVYKDGSINLLKQYGNKKFQDLGKLMLSAEQIDEVFVGDVDGNKYEDIIIKNGKEQIRVYTNDDGVFDVDGNLVCLNTNATNGKSNQNPENTSGVIQLFIDDMDNDGRSDIITLDKKGYLKIIYGNGTKSRHSYLSKDAFSCDENRLERQEGATKIVKKFGIQLATDGISDESIIRWNGLMYPDNSDVEKEVIDGSLDPNAQKTDLEEQGIYIDPAFLEKLKSGEIDKSEIQKVVELSNEVDSTEQAQKTAEAASLVIKNPFVGKYIDLLNDANQAFITFYNVEKYNSLTNTKKANKPTKKYKDLNGGELEDGDDVEVTVSITTNGVQISEFFDKISGPWIVDRDPNTGAPKDLTFIKGNGTIIQGTEGYDYGIINGKGSSGIAGGGALQFKYTLKYHLEDPIYRIRIIREKPLTNIATVKKAEDEDITILRRNGLKYEEKNNDILIKNPFGKQLNINDGLNIGEQAYINVNNIGDYITRTSIKEINSIEKNYKDLNGGMLEGGDSVEVTVKILMPKNHANINAIFEDIKGPRNESGIPREIKFTNGNGTIKSGINGYDFYITNINPIENDEGYIFEYKYNLTYKDTEGNPNSDNLPSIIVQPVDGCVKKEEVLENTKENKNRAYKSEIIDLQELAKKYAEGKQAANDEATNKINAEIYGAEQNGTESSTILNSAKEKYSVEDLLKDAWGDILNNNGLNLGNIDLDITKVFGTDLKKIEGNIQNFANSLCNGFTFGTEGGSKTCEGLPVPFNQAFLAPGSYHIMGCIPLEPLTQTLGKGLPMFHFPGTLWVPTPAGTIPIPIPWGLKSSSDEFLRAPGGFTGYPSMIRIYAAPTLTAQLGIAICMGPQNVALKLPSPVADIGGNCIVTAIALPCGGDGGEGGDDDDGEGEEESFEDWIGEYGQTNICNPKESESPFTMIASSTLNTNNYPTSPNEGPYLGGAVSIDYDTITSDNFGDSGDTGIEINGVQIKGAKDAKNKLLGGLQQGIQKIIVNWIDNQVQYWINNLLRFEIQFTFPDISYLSEEINKIGSNNIQRLTASGANKQDINIANGLLKKYKNSAKNIYKTITTNTGFVKADDNIRELNLANGMNPFKELQELFNNSDLVKVSTQNIPIRVPRIYSEDIESYKNYLLTRYSDNSTILNGWIATAEAAVSNCKKEEKTDPTKGAHCQAIENAQAKLLKMANKFEKIGPQIFENVQTLEAYKRFPLQIYEWLHVTDKYLGDITALVANFFGYINYWMDVNANRFSQYCDAIITIVTIVKTYQVMIDLFVDWGSKCGKCTQDTYDQYSCKLSFLCSAFEIPVIPIPSVKIPSLYIDLSNINLQMNILLPRFSFKPESIELPRLPNLPQPPQLGINFNIDFDIPDIPQLPQPPELPELPSFIPQVKMELPILPPAPDIPEIPNQITGLLSVAKTLSKIFCIIKSGIGLVGESAVKARIEQLTQRSYEVPWVDNLDLTMFFKQTPLQGIDIEVDSYVNLQYNFDAFYALLKSIVDPINNATYSLLKQAQNGVNYLDEKTSDFSNKLNDATDQTIIFNAEISKNTPDKMKEQLYELRDSLGNLQDKEKVNKILSFASIDTKVKKNEKGIKKIEDDLNKLIENEKENINSLAELAKNDYDSFLNTIQNRKEEGPYQLTFTTNLLNKNETVEKAITNTNATAMLIETENKKVEGYYSALKNHTASELNMSEETYENSIKYMASIKDTIKQRYSIKGKEYAGTIKLVDEKGESISKTLITATSNTTPSINDSSSTDYSQYVNGIFIKDGEKTISAVNSEYNYNKFIGYYEKDLDKDGENELIMRDNFNLFVKYFEKGNNTKGKKSITIKPTLKEGSKKQYVSAGGLFSNQIKVYDENAEVKNFTLKGQSFDSLSFSWDNNKYEAISGYLMRIIERVDGFREKNSQNTIKYILFLPNGAEEEIDDKRIQLQGNTQKIKTLLGNQIYDIKYYNPSDDTLKFNLPEVPRKREYIEVTTVKLNETVYQQNAPWSNQLVGGRQAIADAEPPKATVQLERVKKNNEIIDEGLDLEGYVGTYYNLRITRTDDTKVRQTKLIEFDEETNTGKVLNEKDFDKFTGIVLLPNLFFTKKQKKQYTIYAVDSQGNETEETINLDIQVPGITIENIERNEGFKEGIKNPVSITSELETDIDKGDVTFERFRNNTTTPIEGTEGGGSKQTYPVTTNQTKVTGQYYDYGDSIGIYSKDNKQMGNINGENGEIEIKPEYEGKIIPRVDLSQGFPVIKLIEGDSPIFEITIQPEKLIKTEVYQGTLINLEGENYGMFNGGQAILKDGKAILYIAPNGTIYTTENLQGDYTFNKSDETVTYKIYETFGSDIASITFKAKPLE